MDAPFSPAASSPADGGELFVDMMSQPSRACCFFVHLARLPLTRRQVILGRKEQLLDSFPNPLKQVPCLVERDGFVLPESSAILKYLADRHAVADHWYPRELRARARVNAALDWQHFSLRRGAAGVTWFSLIARNMGMKTDPGMARAMLNVLRGALGKLEKTWLTDEAPFMMGSSQPCIADLLVSEVCFLLTTSTPPVFLTPLCPPAGNLQPHAPRGDRRGLWDASHAGCAARGGSPEDHQVPSRVSGPGLDEWRSIHGILHTARDKMAAKKKTRSRM